VIGLDDLRWERGRPVEDYTAEGAGAQVVAHWVDVPRYALRLEVVERPGGLLRAEVWHLDPDTGDSCDLLASFDQAEGMTLDKAKAQAVLLASDHVAWARDCIRGMLDDEVL
jgi:hypothetical protein